EGAIARQHDVQAIHNLVKRFFTLKRLSNVHKKIRKQVSVSGFLHSHWIGQLIGITPVGSPFLSMIVITQP
ncbi:TPA: hypothetical protein OQV22_002521, partial [Shigella flexneri]|nr:hypothetical protein [Shigella flexneri]